MVGTAGMQVFFFEGLWAGVSFSGLGGGISAVEV